VSYAQTTRLHPLTAWCQQQGIIYRLAPIAYPQANGKFDPVHRLGREDIYQCYHSRPVQTWTAWFPQFVTFYKTQREHSSRNWRTPVAMFVHLQYAPDGDTTTSVTAV